MLARPAAVLLLAAAVLGGCASGKVREANDYVSAVNRAQTSFATTSQRLMTAMSPGGATAAEQATLQRFYSAVDGFVARLRAIQPPARVQALHGRLIAAMQRFGRSLRSAGAAIVSHDAGRILDGQQQLATATTSVSHTIDTTIAAINAKLHG